MVPGDLLMRRLCGKSGSADDLSRALGITEDRFHVLVRSMRKRGDPVTTRESVVGSTIFDFSRGERVCAFEGCGLRLSRYNPTPYCTLHTVPEELPDEWFRPDEEPGKPCRRIRYHESRAHG